MNKRDYLEGNIEKLVEKTRPELTIPKQTKEDILKLSKAGVDAFLIGESFMRAENPGEMLNEFLN